jgi:hypothetical protein
MEKFKALYHQNISSIKASEELTSILNQQMNPKLKDGLGYEKRSSNDHPSNTKPIKFVKSTIIDNNHSVETKKQNQPPRRNEIKGTKTEYVDQRNNTNTSSNQRNHQHGRNRLQAFFQVQRFFLWLLFFLF